MYRDKAEAVCALLTDTPVGTITLLSEGDALTGLYFGQQVPDGAALAQTPVLAKAAQELAEYFDRKRTCFTVPLAPRGTPFQLRCWQVLQQIPYGQTITYGEEAARAGNPKACRAVGMANHHNPISIFIPCHRVVGKDGSLTGYGGGMDKKRFLLQLEQNKKG